MGDKSFFTFLKIYLRRKALSYSNLIRVKDVRQPSPVSSLFAEPRNYLCPTDSAATVASVPTQEMRSAVRQNGQCSGDLRDGHQRSSAEHRLGQ